MISNQTREKIGLPTLSGEEELANALGTKVTTIEKAEFSKDEQALLQSNALLVEDHDIFQRITNVLGKGDNLIRPTFSAAQLALICQQNNTLLQAVSAMEVNCESTGFEIEPKNPVDDEEEDSEGDEKDKDPDKKAGAKKPADKPKVEKDDRVYRIMKTAKDAVLSLIAKKETPPKKAGDKTKATAAFPGEEEKEEKSPEKKAEEEAIKGIKAFFDEPYPDMSFTTIRRKIRRDIESTGNGYMEVVRDAQGRIAFLKELDAVLTFMVKLDDPVEVEKTMERLGEEVTVKVFMRERRYAQLVGTKIVYFKEFGAQRKLSRTKGHWEGTVMEGVALGVEAGDEATEVIHFTAIKDVVTPYGVPRWINQVPSVLGSRRAEEYNLEFFNHGGMPPFMILIQGGALSKEARANLTQYMAGQAKHKQRGVIAEIFSTSGDLGSAGSVKVSVERFGAERQNDSMFEKYDERCHQRVRGSFRLPPLFLGLAEDYSFATAYASYIVAEAQVFKPERDEFDEMINVKIMREIAPEFKFRSKPVSVVDIEQKMKALEMVKDMLDPDNLMEQLNEIAGLELERKPETPEDQKNAMKDELMGEMQEEAKQAQARQSIGAQSLGKFQKLELGADGQFAKVDERFLLNLANDYAAHLNGDSELTKAGVDGMKGLVDDLSPTMRTIFNGYVGLLVAQKATKDPEETSELIAAAADKA